MSHSRHTSTGSGRSAGSARSRISKTSNVSRSTSTSTSSHVKAGNTGGVISRMLSTFQKKNQHQQQEGRPTDTITTTSGSSDRKAKYPRLGAIGEDKENWVARYQVTHHPDRPLVDKRTRPDLRKGEDGYRADLVHMQERNAERRVRAAAVAARRNMPPAIHSSNSSSAGASRPRGLGLRTDVDVDMDMDMDFGMPNFSYSSSSPKGSRENLSSASPVFRRTEWQHASPGGLGVGGRLASGMRGEWSDEAAWSASPVSPGAMTIKVAFHPEPVVQYHEMPVSAPAPNPGDDDDNDPRSLSLLQPFTAPVYLAAAQRNPGLDDDDDNEHGRDDGGNRPSSHSRNNDNKTRRRRSSAAGARGGVPQTHTRATRGAHHKRATRDSRTWLYADANAAAQAHRASPRHCAASPLAPRLALDNSSTSSSLDSAGPPTPTAAENDDNDNMERLRRNSSNYSSTRQSFLLLPPTTSNASYPRSGPKARHPTCPLPGCYAPLTATDDLKHNLCSGCRRELQPRASTFYGSRDDDDGDDLEILIQRRLTPVHPRGGSSSSSNNNSSNIRRTDVSRTAHHGNLSSRFNSGGGNGGDFKLQPAPPGRARSKRLAQQRAHALGLRAETGAAAPPPTYQPPPPPPVSVSTSTSSSSLQQLLLSSATTSSSSSHIGFQLAAYSSSSSGTRFSTPKSPGPILLEPKTFQPSAPAPTPAPASSSPRQQQQRPSSPRPHPHPHHAAPPPSAPPAPPSPTPTTPTTLSEDLYQEIASIIDCYVRAERLSAWENERRKADAVASYYRSAEQKEDPNPNPNPEDEDVEMRRRGFF
ncbi:hypothetical protein F4775DRAFT_601756 [Biscogniauxia sp. FL1348]|nr:hypothetical protein F4775DRAFT_601756 [Biscogniauxia sp. FL1348]